MAPQGKSVFSETSASLTAPHWKPLASGIGLGANSQGEGPFVYKSNTEDKWLLWIEEFSRIAVLSRSRTDLASGQWAPSEDFRLPSDPCHGVVRPVTADECERLSSAWGSVGRI